MNSGSRQQALVEAAFNCIAARGFEGLRLREVAKEAGIDHSTLHHYFPTKEDLVAAVVEHATRQFWKTMPPQPSAAATVRYHLAVLADMIRARPELFAVLRELDLRAARDARIAEVVTRSERGWHEALRGVLAEALPGADVAATADLVISVARGVSLAPDQAPAVFAQLEVLLDLTD
ncbi:helix-turn-helix domain-containing protein [Nonomuraea longicatena]|uniref:TetR/AcrR family transcriptional regulator n=1 Tax=Nonomuraea longicatena TaxID=83682 RepID=A0ABN1QG56_9ACTN